MNNIDEMSLWEKIKETHTFEFICFIMCLSCWIGIGFGVSHLIAYMFKTYGTTYGVGTIIAIIIMIFIIIGSIEIHNMNDKSNEGDNK